jgi:hypothetical protein
MRALHDDTELVNDTVLPDGPEDEGVAADIHPVVDGSQSRAAHRPSLTMAEAMRAQLPYLPPHLKSTLLDTSSLFPPPSATPASPAISLRLDDTSIRALLSTPPLPSDPCPDIVPSSSTSASSWSDDPLSPPEIRHLSLTLHPAPLSLLRDIPHFPGVTLTALNLAYGSIRDLERLVSALPPGLRELGLAGVRLGHGPAPGQRHTAVASRKGGRVYEYSEEDAKRDMAAMGRKMLVLRVSATGARVSGDASLRSDRALKYRCST